MPGKRKSKEDRKREIVEAAYKIALREGVQAITTRAVATEAGLSNGLVHFHFPGKDALTNALLELLLEWLKSDDARTYSFQESSSSYLNGLLKELAISADDRIKMKLFLEFWILSLHNESIKKRLKEASNISANYFTSLFNEDKKKGLNYTERIDLRSLNALSLALILGSSLQDIIEENWGEHNSPWKLLEDILK